MILHEIIYFQIEKKKSIKSNKDLTSSSIIDDTKTTNSLFNKL